MQTALNILQIVTAIILSALVLLQQKGSGLGSAFGGGGEVYTTKRGAEKVIYNATILFSIVFLGLALINSVIV